MPRMNRSLLRSQAIFGRKHFLEHESELSFAFMVRNLLSRVKASVAPRGKLLERIFLFPTPQRSLDTKGAVANNLLDSRVTTILNV